MSCLRPPAGAQGVLVIVRCPGRIFTLHYGKEGVGQKIKTNNGEAAMDDSVYKVIEIVGTSEKSWDDAAKNAVARASKTLEDLRIAEVTAQDLKIENGKVTAYRTKLSLSFKFRGE